MKSVLHGPVISIVTYTHAEPSSLATATCMTLLSVSCL